MSFFTNIWEGVKNFSILFVENSGLSFVKAIAVLLVGLIIIKIIEALIHKATIRSRKLDKSISTFIVQITSTLLFLVLVIYLLKLLKIINDTQLTAMVVTLGAAIALGLQGVFGSLVNGILIIFTKPFKQGDYIQSGEKKGYVKNIKLFNTTIVTTDNKEVIIPNCDILNKDLTNYTALSLIRIEIIIPIPYSADIKKVKEIVLLTVNEHPNVANSPLATCRLSKYNESSLDFTLFAWVTWAEYWDTRYDLFENVFNALKENNIEIPFNQLDIHIPKNEDTNELKTKLKSIDKIEKIKLPKKIAEKSSKIIEEKSKIINTKEQTDINIVVPLNEPEENKSKKKNIKNIVNNENNLESKEKVKQPKKIINESSKKEDKSKIIITKDQNNPNVAAPINELEDNKNTKKYIKDINNIVNDIEKKETLKQSKKANLKNLKDTNKNDINKVEELKDKDLENKVIENKKRKQTNKKNTKEEGGINVK